MNRTRVAYLLEPRFPGGTSAAVASELRAATSVAEVKVFAYTSRMFKEREIAPSLERTLDDLSLSLEWDPPLVAADLVIVHNPAFLKFETAFATRIVTPHLIVVTHENFTRPGGAEPFYVTGCLGLLARSGVTMRRSLAPVSRHNRSTVSAWLHGRPEARVWDVLDADWHNICETGGRPPTERPRDRRGRHSRAGFEKFPPMRVMDACFPDAAEANVILGADLFLRHGIERPHWTLLPFGGVDLASYFDMIDFMIYFCAPTFRESFGRVIADATSAGKVVITDPDTAAAFGEGVISARPDEVDAIVARLVASPERYGDHVRAAQTALAGYSSDAFLARHRALLTGGEASAG